MGDDLTCHPLYADYLRIADGPWACYSCCVFGTTAAGCLAHNDAEHAPTLVMPPQLVSGRYSVLIQQDEDGDFVAGYPDLPGCMTHGATVEEALRRAEEAKMLWMEAALQAGLIVRNPTDIVDLMQEIKKARCRS